MHKIDSYGNVSNQFTEGDPANTIPATVVSDDWLNAVQGEIVAAIEAAGIVLDKADNTQLLAAIQSIGSLDSIKATSTYFGSLSAALADIGTVDQTTLIVNDLCTLAEAETATITSNITLERRGAGLIKGTGTGSFLTFATGADLAADNHQIFGDNLTVTGLGKLSIKWWGATGDGVTDDSVGFAAAVTSALTSGATIIVPEGTYLLPSQITIGSSTFRVDYSNLP